MHDFRIAPFAKRFTRSALVFIPPKLYAQLSGFESVTMAMKPTKPRAWTEDEVKLLIELAHLKMDATNIAKKLGRYTASVKRRAWQLGLLLPASKRGPQQ
jgi:hypothetical protein